MDKDNANPAILNPSDLPSRRRIDDDNDDLIINTQSTKTNSIGGGLFDGLIPSYPYYDSLNTATPLSPPESPTLSPASAASSSISTSDLEDNEPAEEIDTQEIYDLISTISDPEHPLSLGSLAVVNLPDISIKGPSSPRSRISTVRVLITPTITHCSLATVIGLGVRVRLEQALPPRFRIDVRIKEGTHASDEATNKQLADKERVAAAMENATLVGVIRKMLSTCE
ncbi:hypothetical protein AAFC00_000443 [Neodothiora populina]|uniref:MIP18 family-like domain-containing protein n=1 Tax=Neodothiora populina TaxID=2781224 RepID=A0ABR3PCW5_9PEZI